MEPLLIAAGSALWLGILTSISPCPLATNIAAVAYIARQAQHPRKALYSGLLYTLGRTFAYAALGTLFATGIVVAFEASQTLQSTLTRLVGPLLIVTGMAIAGLITIPVPSFGGSGGLPEKLSSIGIWGSFPLGMLFALSFCPVSAALFFGGLLPLAAGTNHLIALTAVFGVGTSLPVVAVAVLTSLGIGSMTRFFDSVTQADRWLRPATGIIFLVVGVYLTLTNVFGVSF